MGCWVVGSPPCGWCWGDGEAVLPEPPLPQEQKDCVPATLQLARDAGVTHLFWILESERRVHWRGAWEREMERVLAHTCTGQGAEISCVIVSSGCLGLFPFTRSHTARAGLVGPSGQTRCPKTQDVTSRPQGLGWV